MRKSSNFQKRVASLWCRPWSLSWRCQNRRTCVTEPTYFFSLQWKSYQGPFSWRMHITVTFVTKDSRAELSSGVVEKYSLESFFSNRWSSCSLNLDTRNCIAARLEIQDENDKLVSRGSLLGVVSVVSFLRVCMSWCAPPFSLYYFFSMRERCDKVLVVSCLHID